MTAAYSMWTGQSKGEDYIRSWRKEARKGQTLHKILTVTTAPRLNFLMAMTFSKNVITMSTDQ